MTTKAHLVAVVYKNNNMKYKSLQQEQQEARERKEKWDHRFLNLAREYASWSKDESTKVGCVITARDRTVISGGYNGLPRRADDTTSSRLLRPEKYYWFEHAERNAIYNSAKQGVALAGSTLYSTLCPCMDCARGIIQSGIKRVVCPELEKDGLYGSMWEEHFKRTTELFNECGVELNFVEE